MECTTHASIRSSTKLSHVPLFDVTVDQSFPEVVARGPTVDRLVTGRRVETVVMGGWVEIVVVGVVGRVDGTVVEVVVDVTMTWRVDVGVVCVLSSLGDVLFVRCSGGRRVGLRPLLLLSSTTCMHTHTVQHSIHCKLNKHGRNLTMKANCQLL